ncbi:MAG TPA: glycoside hydrolase family 95 protein [Acidobacteriaceae bacterium]
MTITRRDFLRGSAAATVLPGNFSRAARSAPSRQIELIFARPAGRWMEAVPVGNGRIGGMIFGGASEERIALTESTVWSGAPSDSNVNPTALENLSHIREIMFAGKYVEGGELCKQHLLGRMNSFGTNLPMAHLELAFGGEKAVENYRRSLNLDEAIAQINYTRAGVRFHREVFASNPDDALVIRQTSNRKGSIDCDISFGKLDLPGEVQVEGDTLVLRGHAWEKMHSNGHQGVFFETRVRLIAEGGTVAEKGECLAVRSASAFTLLVVVGTDYKGGSPSAICKRSLDALAARSYSELRASHVADHQALFGRVSIDLGSNSAADDQPTDERRKAVESGKEDPGLIALFFQYGRYLTIAGSRANSPLPLALQGIWNDGLASSMGWTDDFHLDINTQQNYWAAEVCNLSECHAPLFDLIDLMRSAGRSTAHSMYGAPGWVAHVVTNAWGYTAPGAGLGWGIFVTGGVWLALDLWQHYRFTLNERFLRQRGYPVLKDAAEFFLASMVKDPQRNWLVTGPSVSPENWFLSPEGKPCSESMGPTIDRVMLNALLSACIEASSLLGLDAEFRERAQNALEQLPPLQIGKYGQLQEWLEDFEEAQPNHRHTAHLTALYPEDQISPLKTPALAKAAQVTIERRISQPNWEDSEWGRANFVAYYARLLDGDSAHKHLIGLLAHATDDSLLTYSLGGVAGAQSNIFAIDGNCAGAAGIAEMLLQSHSGEIHLLPALPSSWTQGSIRGLCARGGVEVSMSWAASKLTSATLKGKVAGEHAIRYRSSVVHVALTPGHAVKLNAREFA